MLLSSRSFAFLALLFACAFWALGFPLERALSLAQAQQIPGAGSWFISSWCLALRFLLAALLLAGWCAWKGQLRGWTRQEVTQAVGLGVFTAGGMLLKMDGLSYTSASTSAFVSQSHCVFLPLFFAVRDRRLPRWPVVMGCTLVLLGIAVLSGIDLQHLTLGRGEVETLIAAMLFTGQILWAERIQYVHNHMGRVSCLAFAITGLLYLPLVAVTAPSAHALIDAYSSWPSLLCLFVLTTFCTLGGMILMFTYQRRVGATTASVIYCTEPLFASGFAFVLPGILSVMLNLDYANESMTVNLLIGGLLVVASNLIVHLNLTVDRPSDNSAARRKVW
jgi:drug/metabolite transporter (DMT)-like permease